MSARPVARTLAPRPTSPVGALLGAAYVVVLAVWAAREETGDPRDLGENARQIEALVLGRFGGEIGRIGVAVIAAAVVVGALLGLVAGVLVATRDRLHRPERTTGPRHAFAVLVVVAMLHAALELWAMAHDPQLYAAAWYSRGGWRRTVEVISSDVLHPDGVVLVSLLAMALYLAGPRSGWPRWPGLLRSAIRDVRARALRLASGGAAGLAALVLARVLGTFRSRTRAHPRTTRVRTSWCWRPTRSAPITSTPGRRRTSRPLQRAAHASIGPTSRCRARSRRG